MNFPWTRKLMYGAALDERECAMIRAAIVDVRVFRSGADIISHGSVPRAVHVILSGFACRYKIAEEGGRQIAAYLLPGDSCDLNVFILGRMDHSIGALSRCEVAYLPHEQLTPLLNEPRIARALWWSTLVDEAILREWLLNIGRRNSEQRVAHLFCELFLRFESIGLVRDNAFDFPLTQTDLGDTLGITPVHTNRVLQQLRAAELIILRGGRLQILDLEGLRDRAGFEDSYLHRSKPSAAAAPISGGSAPAMAQGR